MTSFGVPNPPEIRQNLYCERLNSLCVPHALHAIQIPDSIVPFEIVTFEQAIRGLKRSDIEDPGAKYRGQHMCVKDAQSVMDTFLGTMASKKSQNSGGNGNVSQYTSSKFNAFKKKNEQQFKLDSRKSWMGAENLAMGPDLMKQEAKEYAKKLKIAGISSYHLDKMQRTHAYLAAAGKKGHRNHDSWQNVADALVEVGRDAGMVLEKKCVDRANLYVQSVQHSF